MKLFSLLTAAVCLLFVSACASTPVPTDERVHIMDGKAADVQPGNVYASRSATLRARSTKTAIWQCAFSARRPSFPR